MAASNNKRAISTIDNLDLDSFNLQRQKQPYMFFWFVLMMILMKIKK